MTFYVSSRDHRHRVSAHQAIIAGLAPDQGLYIPDGFRARLDLGRLTGRPYQDVAAAVCGCFLDGDYSAAEIRAAVEQAYGSAFDDPAIVPLRPAGNGCHLLELWHGPTSAFKDLALTMLPHLLTMAYAKQGLDGTVAILTATSGDTGKAALAGFRDVEHTTITVLYPQVGVAPLQKLQMQTSPGANVDVIAVQGNFDDCQRIVKQAFADPDMLRGHPQVVLSSANSINVGRLIPQVAYYVSAYLQLVDQGAVQPDQPVNFCVPTGNFGDILAGYLAKLIGLPVGRLICASNRNNVLTDFITTGRYDANRPFHNTISPSMDILVSSNLERLLALMTDDGGALVGRLMADLAAHGRYEVPDGLKARIQDQFSAYWASEEQCRGQIISMFEQHRLLIDPHTAVACQALQDYRAQTGDMAPAVVLATASPFKFPDVMLDCLQGQAPDDPFAALDRLSTLTGRPVPPNLAALAQLPIRFDRTITVEQGLAVLRQRIGGC